MAEPLLATKLYIPPARPQLVPRLHLIERLNASRSGKLTLVSAPAGFGKTTLLSEWSRVTEPDAHVVWVSLDQSDGDPVRFWDYVVAALGGLQVDLGKNALALLHSPQPPPIESVLTILINDITATPSDFVLVLDDYHVIGSEAIHNGMTFLVNHLPPQAHLVIGSRIDPPLPLARWRASGQLTEMRAGDLRFTPEEVAAFFNVVMGLGLSDEDIAALESRTEGWIASLQMVALSMHGRKDVSDFIRDFSGSNRFILDYLIEEVLQRQEEKVRSFLLETCVLDRLTAPLCDVVTGRNDSREMLRQLETTNLFMEPLDNNRQWYRYHHLFVDLLRNELSISQPDLQPVLHCRASYWYDQQGLILHGVKHALDAQDYEHVVRLIEQHATEIFQSSELNTLVGWIKALPSKIVEERPLLSMIYGWVLLATGYADEAEQCMRNIERVVGTTADVLATDNVERKSITPDILGALVEVTVLRGNLAVRRYDIPLVLELMQRVLPYTGDDRQPYLYNPPSALRTVVIFNMALAYELSGQVKAASQAFVQATKLGSEQHNHFIVMYSMSHLVELLILQGQLREADKTCQQALQRDSEMAGPSSQIIGFAHVCLSNLLYERNELEMALTHLQDGISLLKPWGDLYGLLFGYIALARIKSAQGDWQSTFEAVDELIELCSTSEAQTMFPRVEAFRASLWIKQGNLDAAQQWAETSGLSADGDLVYLREGETITLARVLIAQEKLDCAMQLLTRLLAAAQDGGRDGQVIEILTLEAVALKTQGKQAEALTALKRALVLGEPEGYIRTFIDKGEAVVALLRQAKGPGIALNYVAKLLAASEVEAEKRRRVRSPAPTIVQPLIEPLSRRELEVLRLMAAGLSNRQIADKLYLSINTVKWYTRHIFGKLGVSRRTQAVNCAHALDIL